MTGEELYAIWSAANEAHDCGVATWDEMDEFDRACWNTFALKLSEREAS